MKDSREYVVFDIDWTVCELEQSTKPYCHTLEEIRIEKNYDKYRYYKTMWYWIIFLTWRKYNDYHDITVKWLSENWFEYDWLIMNKDWQPEENHIFKKRALRIIMQLYNINIVLDDNPLVWEVCKKLKIQFYQC